MFDQFITYEMVTTFGSLAILVFMFVEFTKEIPGIKSIPTKYYAGLVALSLIIIAALRNGNFDYWNIPLYILSSIAITFTSTGAKDFNKSNK